MWQVNSIVLAFLCRYTLCQLQDVTRTEGAAGPQVVDSVVNLIRDSCVFPSDHLLLRRLANAATNYGQTASTYRPGFNGGIWQVSEQNFQATQNQPKLAAYYREIGNTFGIDWNTVHWSDLRKPLYSGLATILLLTQQYGDNIPVTAELQGVWYQNNLFPTDPMAAYNFTKTSSQLEGSCSSLNLDLAFLVDSSSSLSPVDFQNALNFAASVLDPFNIGPNSVQVAFMMFGTGFKTVFAFDTYSNKSDIQAAIRTTTYVPGETDTDQALHYAANTLFTAAGGARQYSAKVAVVITDGKPTHYDDAVAKARELREKGVTIFVIGVGADVNSDQMSSMATEPICTHVQLLQDYQALDTFRADIQQLSCSAPVILPVGNYSFPCDTPRAYRIPINGDETITVRPSNGTVNVYGSFLNSNPNTAFNEFVVVATATEDAIVYVHNESRPLYVSVESQAADPNHCPSGVNYAIIVQNRNALHFGARTKCYENGILRDCTPLDILSALYRVIQPASLGFPSPCQLAIAGYFTHPQAYDRFIYCDGNGIPYIVLCPSLYWYNDNSRACLPGTPPPLSVSTAAQPTVSISPIPTITPFPSGNPCTEDALRHGLRFFPYPADDHKYIACTEWPNYGVIKECALYHKWSQKDLSCIYADTVIDPSHNLFLTSPKPEQVACQAGLHDGDLFYHPYPGNTSKYIQCDQFGDAFVKDCPPGRIWNQHFLTCVFGGSAPVG